MALQYRKAKSVGKGTRVNVSASKRGPGVSLSKRVGPLTLNSRGRGSLRIAPGVSFRFGKNNGAGALIGVAVLAAVVLARLFIVALTLALMLSWWLLKWLAFGTMALFAWALSLRKEKVPELPAAE